jgi:hypothetical protein
MPIYKSTRPSVSVPTAGQYFFTTSPANAATSATLSNAVLRLSPWVVERSLNIDRIGAEITAVGDAGSKLRIGIYADNGACLPGALLLDAGTIAGDSATVQDIALGTTLALPSGLYWVGGAVQVVTTTQPTVRVQSNWTPPVPLPGGTSAPGSGATHVCVFQNTGVTGALPALFTYAGTTSPAPRIHVRAA